MKRKPITIDVSGYKKMWQKAQIIDAVHLLLTEQLSGRLKVTSKPFQL